MNEQIMPGRPPTATYDVNIKGGSISAVTQGTTPWIVDGSGVTQPVSGTVTANQGTSPWVVSLTSTTITGTVAATQSGTWNITNISGTVSLPTGAATAAKQPALGTAGTASADVITVQGIASMTALKVDGSAVTQPVSLTSTTITGTVAVTQSGTWTVQPGNTANTTAWLVTGTGGTFPATQSGTWNIGTVTAVTAITNALPAGSNAIGKLAANDGVDIGDVTINNLTSTPVYVQHNTTSVGTGRTTVTTAGTRVALASSTACKWVVITAETDNTGLMAVGGTGVVAALATRQGTPLYAGDSVTIMTDNLADINIDSTVNGDGVTYTYGA